MLYDWLKALHIISVIAWMAGMLYLPRLFVYHVASAVGSESSEVFKVMERRLLRFIINPAMVVTWIIGLWMAISANWFQAGWFHGKLTLLLLLTFCHVMFARWTRHFQNDQNIHSQRFFRIMNEVPTVLMIGIVILVIIKPF
jgi:putative membrane protein